MNLYNKDGIIVSTIEEQDKKKVLEYFSENTFNCDYETGALRPTNSQFMQIMEGIISGEDDENSILVLKKDGEVIGYESMHVEYDRLNIGHVAVKESERGKGYGELLTRLAILIAENEERDVGLYCQYSNNKYFKKLGLATKDNIHYLYKRKGIKTERLPKLFVSVSEYRERQDKKLEEKTKRFAEFLGSDIMQKFNKLDGEYR